MNGRNFGGHERWMGPNQNQNGGFFNQQIFFIGIKNKIYKNINAITHILINLIYFFDLNIFY